ncbi:MAG: DNA/RNA nuclease SfsA [Deltaproteobacteria bacterium]|nr:DNA/RNA nuclease SfsA [Deltaproteobacteria bacterium]
MEIVPSANIVRGRFIERLNRFVLRCIVEGQACSAYLPNPGRLWEILLPGCALFLVKNHRTAMGKPKLPWTVVAARRRGRTILLHTHLTNQVVARLLEGGLIPSLAGARIVRREVRADHSRFDFLLERAGLPYLLEVKSCTLFGDQIAMFPDAVTERGSRHLQELAAISAREGLSCGVVFMVHSGGARFFLPDYHTDPAFARTFLQMKDRLDFRAVAVTWGRDLRLRPPVRELEIPWDLIDRENRDSGSYLLVMEVARDLNLTVGGLGEIFFRKGYYLYVGSARRGLASRLARHLRRRKTFFWHIDYLRDRADDCRAIPIRASMPLEHDIAAALEGIADWTVPGFGSSDCRCPTHLFGMKAHPLRSRAFLGVLQHFRIDRLEADLPGK